ncbi:hypothetical protein [Flagellimonas lutimaris]|uniref:hypothetical protein n=1 Tax=Flagellimonas TaxID=444459 RepID=UPI000FF163A1|nr:MAG: hypothetical protein CBB72_017195 [Muricauda sp. TMED12]
MLKALLFPIISFLLILSISTSPIIPLLDKALGKTMILSSAEEEKSSKNEESDKKFDEMDAYFKYFLELASYQIIKTQGIDFLGYIFPTSDYTIEILDPPPRKLV